MAVIVLIFSINHMCRSLLVKLEVVWPLCFSLGRSDINRPGCLHGDNFLQLTCHLSISGAHSPQFLSNPL